MTIETQTINGHTYEVAKDAGGNVLWQSAIDALPAASNTIISKIRYRGLFTLAERIAIDNFASSVTLTPQQKATLEVMHNDFLATGDMVDLSSQYMIQATSLLEQYGLIAAGRAAQVLSQTPVSPM